MARDLPPPTPEGALVRRVRESIRPRMSIPAAADRAGVSEVTWGNVERGYKGTGKDSDPIRIVATAQTLAHMAYAIGLRPADLQKVGREDAAAVLAEMVGPDLEVIETPVDRGVMLIAVSPDLPDEDREEVKRSAERLAAYLDERRKKGQS